ncbi:hypothetical protein [uncultured Brevundimonas sp.]|uniref:hypothetical protein n=1 Tax=uncultured Brevundimonas sp. TaxID=213418 RepID=UPI0025FA2A18|nr:hypothetical protein [uncultured Brevundimonas sp.]
MAAKTTLTDAQRKPPKGVATQAKRGLDLRDKHDRGGTEVGVRRAHQLADQKPVSDKDIKDIYSYFARHTVDKDSKGWGSRTDPSAGYIAWLLWGGDPAERWIKRLHDRLEKANG